MTTPFRQTILPGDDGSDVWAYKRAYLAAHVKGAGTLGRTRHAGAAFVTVTKQFQRQNHLRVDGKCGPATHKLVAPHFDAYGAMLYRTAPIRQRPLPPAPAVGAQALAKRLLRHHAEHRYHADNPGDLRDITATADGRAVWSALGRYVHLDARPLRLLCWLIEEESYRIGTFALCSDHHNDGPHGHAGGLAVDVSSINGVSIGHWDARALTLAVAEKINRAPLLRPRQQICDGYGGVHDSAISACTLPFPGYYDYSTMRGHRDHIHAGF